MAGPAPLVLPLTSVVDSALSVNTGEIEYFTTLFEYYSQQQLQKEFESRSKSKRLAALAVAASKAKDNLVKFLKKVAASGRAPEVAAELAAAGRAPGLSAETQAGLESAASVALNTFGDFYEKAKDSIKGIGPGAVRAAKLAGGLFVAIGTLIETFLKSNFLKKFPRIAVVDARYGAVALPGALKPGSNTGRFFLVDRYKDFTQEKIKAEIESFSKKYGLVIDANFQKKIANKILEHAIWRGAENRYGPTTPLISEKNWEKIRKRVLTLRQAAAKPTKRATNRVGPLEARYSGTFARAHNLENAKKRATNRVGPLGARYSRSQNSQHNIMSNEDVQKALGELLAARPNFAAKQNMIQAEARARGSAAAIAAYLRSLKNPTENQLKNIYGIKFNNQSRLEDLLAMRTSRNYVSWPKNLKTKFNNTIRQKMTRRRNAISRENFDYESLAAIVRAINANQEGYIPGGANYVNSLKRAINRLGTSSSSLRVNEDKLARIAAAVRGVRKMTSVVDALRSAQARIARLRREENMRRRNRGLAPLAPVRSYNYNRIPYYPSNVRPPTYGNMRPTFAPQPNRPQPGVVPTPPPLQPFPAIPANNRARQAPPPAMPSMRPENLLPPTEAAAVTNAGGVNKALNLVENAGGPANVAKTANLLKNVGSPEAAVAAGASPKNVKIVLQLGGPNNALKVASAVPKLKKRRRSKKAKKASKPKAPRVKELKKLIKFLGTKEELIKKLPDPENKEKKLTKNQVVSKITTHLLRKGKK